MPMPGEHPWRVNRAQLRDQLEARRSQLTEELQRLRDRIREPGSRPTLEYAEDDADEADLDASLIDIANSTLRRIDAALERLRSGSYGCCTRCRGPISEARLVAMPFAVRCQRCESARERESRPPRSPFRSRLWAENVL
jgi:DnaK suppressor protein